MGSGESLGDVRDVGVWGCQGLGVQGCQGCGGPGVWGLGVWVCRY